MTHPVFLSPTPTDVLTQYLPYPYEDPAQPQQFLPQSTEVLCMTRTGTVHTAPECQLEPCNRQHTIYTSGSDRVRQQLSDSAWLPQNI